MKRTTYQKIKKAPSIHIIGGVERIDFPSIPIKRVTAKVDTGADISSIWCGEINRVKDRLECVFFAPKSPYYTGKKFIFDKSDYKISRVYNSFGHHERRYKIKLPVIIGRRRILATFTLSDRSKKTHPVLLGRRVLAKKFLVDVTMGTVDMTKKLRGTKRAVAR